MNLQEIGWILIKWVTIPVVIISGIFLIICSYRIDKLRKRGKCAVENTTWIYDDYHCSWVCQNCQLEWSFIEDGPEENGVKYCPKCGCKITEFVGEGI